MCAIIGALVWGLYDTDKLRKVNEILNHIFCASHERGRDGRGYAINCASSGIRGSRSTKRGSSAGEVGWEDRRFFEEPTSSAVLISNLRAEPTTEYVPDKRVEDQQPYAAGDWTIVHNGTIANDRELRTNTIDTRIDSASIAEVLAASSIPRLVDLRSDIAYHFIDSVKKLKGSYAILASHAEQSNHLLAAANYRPIWYVATDLGVFLASSRDYFPDQLTPKMMDPYSVFGFYWNEFDGLRVNRWSLRPPLNKNRALVVCSGGLDSVVAATYTKRVLGYETALIHFRYGSRAEGPEVKAVQDVAKALEVPCTLFPLPVYKPSDSPLLRADSTLAGGEEGAEFAHEWVPARNLLLLSVATAYAEANGFDIIVLGNNLEEAGAYPDNEPEFIHRFNDLLPFAVGDGKRMSVIMPVGNLMKHEIVALGNAIDAPMDKTWSCYRSGALHCGTCGPCYMRRTAFRINHLTEVIHYANEVK